MTLHRTLLQLPADPVRLTATGVGACPQSRRRRGWEGTHSGPGTRDAGDPGSRFQGPEETVQKSPRLADSIEGVCQGLSTCETQPLSQQALAFDFVQ